MYLERRGLLHLLKAIFQSQIRQTVTVMARGTAGAKSGELIVFGFGKRCCVVMAGVSAVRAVSVPWLR